MKSIIILVAFVSFAAIGALVLARNPIPNEWAQYKQQHGKDYATSEDPKRFSLFLENREEVIRHNANPTASHKLGLNHLSDWTPEEFAKLNGLRYNATTQKMRNDAAKNNAFVQSILNDPTPLPAEVDWRKVPNRVSPVKDQERCGSCWAFASTGVLEGQEAPSGVSDSLISLSEQDLIDCSESNFGCEGGRMREALKNVEEMSGIASEIDYPYLGIDGKCKVNKKKVVMTELRITDLPEGEETLRKVVARYGPVAIGIAADKIKSYESGIFDNSGCTDQIDHAVLVVGYGTDSKLGDYWIVKNSWGAKWGENGYIRIKRGVRMCGIGSMATIAKVSK